ncbi:MAG: hypothetical protein HGA54_00310 [Actinobacteria bacterium]|nr:hypothetical protein [Actinomycetota bacterium]
MTKLVYKNLTTLVCALMIATFTLSGCGVPKSSAEETEKPEAAATATDTESKPSEEAVVEAPVKASYDGTDPAVILETYCALSGCHDSESLLNYSDTESAVTRKMQSMCGDEDYSLLTDAQTQAMIDFYLTKAE